MQNQRQYTIHIADQSLYFHEHTVSKHKLTGIEIATLAGLHPPNNAIVLAFLPNGELEDLRSNEEIELTETRQKFIAALSDRSYLLTINGVRVQSVIDRITGGQVRKLGNVPVGHEILLTRVDQPDRHIADHEWVDLNGADIEAFISRKPAWTLNVQGVDLIYHVPTVVARQAIEKAGFDLAVAYHIKLKVRGQPPKDIQLDDVVDLRMDGIEKIRLTRKDIHNGEAPKTLRRNFTLLDVDQGHLDSTCKAWETVIDGGRRWLLIHHYQLPDGYQRQNHTLALEIPSDYPKAEIDMFHFWPPAQLLSGRSIDRTQIRNTICGVEYHGWSRHRGADKWSPTRDNVITHLALVESALLKEIDE
ncbi:MAG TPA: multiubiquitin domain-containing protein [Solimonas sp.]